MIRTLSIRNRQQARRIDTPLLRRITQNLLREALHIDSYELALHLLASEEMAALNQSFLQHEGSTDVITFDHTEPGHDPSPPPDSRPRHLHGEIFLSVPDAIQQAREFKTTWQTEVIRYIIHGLLHLMGHDDRDPASRRSMKRVENQLVKQSTAVFPVSRLGTGTRGKRKMATSLRNH